MEWRDIHKQVGGKRYRIYSAQGGALLVEVRRR